MSRRLRAISGQPRRKPGLFLAHCIIGASTYHPEVNHDMRS